MIDLKELRKDPEAFRIRLRGKRYDRDSFDRFVRLDAEYKELLSSVEGLRKERNEANQRIKSAPVESRPQAVEAAKVLKEKVSAAEKRLAELEPERDLVALRIPNPPHESATRGTDESQSAVVREVGRPSTPDFPIRDHVSLGEGRWIDLERGAKISGSRFAFLHGDLVHLQFALVQYALRELDAAGFRPTVTPIMVREVAMRGTGFFPADQNEIYKIDGEDHYMVGTSEVPLAGLHMDEILDPAELPLRYCGYSTCLRKEAGALGKDNRGIFRVHQFDKVEMFSFAHPDKSWEEHELLLSIEERLLKAFELPYRVVNICDGDLGAPAAKKFDIEAWFPGQGKYREITSCSNCTDFQARRLRCRMKGEGENRLVHTLNGTAVAIGRCLIALVENHQQPDGSVRIPAALRPFMPGGREVIGRG